jgi:predicted TIM-barrel fold metal-dependent hydrolase
MIVDAHCHAGIGDGFNGPHDTEARLERHLARARAAGIQLTVVVPVFNRDYAAANARLATIVRAHEGELIGFGAVHPERDRGQIDKILGRAAEHYGFRGVKVHGYDALPTREVCEAARRYRLTMLVDVVQRVGIIEMMAEQFPDVNFIVPHLGGFAENWAVQMQLIAQLKRFANVYADTSGVRYWDALVRAVRWAGPHKIIFGSDGPLLHPALELYKIRLLRLPADHTAAICGGNIARLLGATPAGTPSVRARPGAPHAAGRSAAHIGPAIPMGGWRQ